MTEYIDKETAIKELWETYEREFPTASGAFDEYATKIVPNVLNHIEPKYKWISVKEKLPETNSKNDHEYDVLCYIPPRDNCGQSGIYLGKIKHFAGDDGSGNFWGLPMPESDWTIWDWSYFEEPIVTHWMPLPEPPKGIVLDG